MRVRRRVERAAVLLPGGAEVKVTISIEVAPYASGDTAEAG